MITLINFGFVWDDFCACRALTDFPRSFREQLELFSTHGVMVSPHGAGLMNAMFLVPFSAVIEIFPYHFDHNIYSTVSTTAGLGYYPIHCYNGTDMWSRYKASGSTGWL